MKTLDEKLEILRNNISDRKVRIMIMGLGSVGTYLLDYLLSTSDAEMEIYVVGRNKEKMVSDVNITRVASLIRKQNKAVVQEGTPGGEHRHRPGPVRVGTEAPGGLPGRRYRGGQPAHSAQEGALQLPGRAL